MHDRLAPGTGIGCTAAFVKMIREKGIEPNAIGVEVISDCKPGKRNRVCGKTYLRKYKESTGRGVAGSTELRKGEQL